MTTKPKDKKVRLSIFRPTKNDEEKNKRFQFIHYAFKSKLFVPLMKKYEKKLGKHMVTKRSDIPDEPYNVNFFLIWDTFEETMKNYWWTFKNIEMMDEKNKKQHYKMWEERKGEHWYWIPKFMMRLWMTIALEDTAYREQMNFLLFTMQGNMNKRWNPEIQHQFPMYTGAYDMNIGYFLEWIKKAGLKKGEKVMLNVGFKTEEEPSTSGTASPKGDKGDNKAEESNEKGKTTS